MERNLQNNIFVIDSEQQYQKPIADCKGSLFQYVCNYSVISCVFLLSTKMYAKRVECRYNHNAKFSLHAKTSVIIFSFSMYKVSSGQPGKLQMTILIYSPCSIQWRS